MEQALLLKHNFKIKITFQNLTLINFREKLYYDIIFFTIKFYFKRKQFYYCTVKIVSLITPFFNQCFAIKYG